MKFENITENIFRLKVPFEDIYTAVFLITANEGAILVDAAAGKRDAEEVILPALAECIDLGEIKYLVCTHLHGDHGGGIRYLLPHLKNVKVAAASSRAIELYGEENVLIVREGECLCGINILQLKGHSLDCVGLLDDRTSTLILGDAVQLYGITKYGCGVGFPAEYRKTLARLSKMNLQRLAASHEYYPLGADAVGDAVKEYIEEAARDFSHVENFVRENKSAGDAVAVAKAFTEEARKRTPDMPSLQSYTVKALLKEV